MNRKLKNAFRETYGSEYPDRKTEFLQNLTSDPRWRKIHPVSSFFRLHPIVMPAGAMTAAAALCLCIVFFAFGGRNIPQPDPPPVIITEMTVTTTNIIATEPARETVTTAADDTDVTDAPKLTSTAENSVTKAAANTEKSTKTSPVAHVTAAPINTTVPAKTTSAPATTTTVVTSVYVIDNYKHDYKFEDCRKKEQGDVGEIIILNPNPLMAYGDEHFFDELRLDDRWLELGSVFNELTCEGTISDLDYLVIEGMPFTIVSVDVDVVYDTYEDDIVNAGETIRIVEPGGYISVDEYMAAHPDDRQFDSWSAEKKATTVIYEPISNRIMPKIGDSYLYFLIRRHIKTNLYSNLRPINDTKFFEEDELFVRCLVNDFSQFIIDGDVYRCCNDKIDITYTRNDLYEDGMDIIDYMTWYDDPDSGRRFCVEHDLIFWTSTPTFKAITSDGKIIYLGTFGTDNDEYIVFYSTKNYTVKWTETGVIIDYIDRNDNDKPGTLIFDIP